MSIFDLNFFKSKKKELELAETSLRIELLQRKIQNEESKRIPPPNPYEQLFGEPQVSLSTYKELVSPYMSVKLVNDILIVVLHDGVVLTKANATKEDFEKIQLSKSLNDILQVISLPEVIKEKEEQRKEVERIEKIQKGIEVLSTLNDFDVIDNTVYIKGSNRSIPELVVNKFLEIVGAYQKDPIGLEDALLYNIEYQALKKFWLKCCLNPSAQSAEDLYTFLSHHQFKIDRHGNFYAYRRVVKVYSPENNSDLVDYISNSYNKVKAVWKKKPSTFEVFNDNGYVLVDSLKQNHGYNNHVGNLKELYENLPSMQENRYTDQHTHSFDYRVGKSVSMPRNEGDDNNQVSCSRGFHCSSASYDYSGFGDTPILVIVNPVDVLAVPQDSVGKLRVCRWFFAMTLPEDEKFILNNEEFDVTDLGDIFEEECMTDLQEYIQTSFAEEVKRHTFAIPQISATELSNVVDSLSKMKDAISKRVSIIK